MLATSLFVGIGASCAEPAPPRPRDGTWYGEDNPPPEPPTKKTYGRWDMAGRLDELSVEREAAPTEHLGGGFSAEIRVDAKARGYAEPGRRGPLAEGALIVEVLRAPGTDAVEALFVMHKQAAGYDPDGHDWEYLVVDHSGQIEDRGRIELCERCHAEAPAEHLFGPRGVL